MFFPSFFLAISTSIDSLGIGITYGIRDMKISYLGKVILFFISFVITLISIWFGDIIKSIFPPFISHLIGGFLLLGMGTFMCFQAFQKDKTSQKDIDCTLPQEEKIYRFFIKCLGITIQIIKNPSSSDFDHSHLIDPKEALFLGLALSLDSFGIGIGGSIMGINSILLPILVGTFQLIFLSLGHFLGKKLHRQKNVPNNIWSILAGVLLVVIGFIRLF